MSHLTTASPWAQLLSDPDVQETGGEHNNDGVDFARYWAMGLLVQMETNKQPSYVILFEYLQDVAVVDSPSNPASATLYQLKKKLRGSWTKTKLCSKETMEVDNATGAPQTALPATAQSSGKPPKKKSTAKLGACSPLGKLHLSVEKLAPIAQAEGVFVSNANYDLKSRLGHPIDPYCRIPLNAVSKDEIQYIKMKLCKDIGCTVLNHFDKLYVEKSTLVPASMRDTIQGQLSRFLHSTYPNLPNVSGQVQEKLLEKFSERSGLVPTGDIDSFAKLVDRKGFTKSDFTEILQDVKNTKTTIEALDAFINDMKAEGFPRPKADKIRAEAARIQVQLVREPEVREAIRWAHAVEVAQKAQGCDEYKEMVAVVHDALKSASKGDGGGPSTEIETYAVAVLAVIDVQQKLTTTSSEYTDQE